MRSFSEHKVILWDFDGVIMDSNQTRSLGFSEVLRDYPEDQVRQLLDFHDMNGGLSRYVKFKYFFEDIRGEVLTNERLNELTGKFSEIMLKLLLNEALLISDSVNFIRENFNAYQMHIVSGSDENELRIICNELDIAKFFITINGSPTPKTQLVSNVISTNSYSKKDVLLVGDSINDLEAANDNGILFFGYNNVSLMEMSEGYIDSFETGKVIRA